MHYDTVIESAWICVSGLQDLSCYGFIKIFESQLLTETFRGSAQAPLRDPSNFTVQAMATGTTLLCG